MKGDVAWTPQISQIMTLYLEAASLLHQHVSNVHMSNFVFAGRQTFQERSQRLFPWHLLTSGSANARTPLSSQFAQAPTCPGIDQLGRCQRLQSRKQSWKILHDKSGPGLSPGQHPARDSWGRSPEISSNLNWCNLSPGPGIASWTVSQHVSSGYSPPQWNNSREEAVEPRGAVMPLISVSRAGDYGRQIALSRLSSLIFRLWLHPFSKRSRLLQGSWAQPFLLVVSDASVWFLRDLTPIGQQGCLSVASELFCWPWRGRSVRG